MKTGAAYTVFLFQFPAFVVGTLGATAAFLGAALPGLAFDRLDVPILGLDSGIQWGRTLGSLAVLGIGIVWYVGFRTRQLPLSMVGCAVSGFALNAVVGPVAVLLGAALGTAMASQSAFRTALAMAESRAVDTWPVVATSAALTLALALDVGVRRRAA